MEDRIMKKSLLFVAAAAMFVFAGCNKEQLAQELKSNNVIHIGVKQIVPATKVAAVDIAANKLSFKWEEGDQVAFTDNDNYERIIIYTCTNPATGEFSGEALDPDATYWVEYPNDYSGTFIYRGNQIPKGHFITNNEEVSGSATTFTLDAHNPIIHFKLKGDAKIGKIKLSNAQENQPIYTLSCGDEGVQLSDEPIDFYMDAQLLDKNRLSGYAYTLSIRDIQDAELKSVSFHLKAENLGTIVDFATPIEVNATTGTAKATIGGSQVGVNWVQLWAGGPKFAEYNIGAEYNKAEDYGGYYNWGMSDVQTSSNFEDYKSGESPLTGDDDTATKLWGSNWRMPTQTELQGLIDNCDVAWTTVNDKNGRKFTGKGAYASNSVFLPAAGEYNAGDVYGQGGYGKYWSSTPGGDDYAYNLGFNSGSQNVEDDARYNGYSVRAVLAE